ncbi:hypothetical protein [Skermanella pratensis]|uniref:hypothetical protein n=1 Tax=Skermanella pratensis TaxID=2233999 RepID=UPI0013016C79|nr:hypothetical protein [Skermanella pratensis]
MHAKPIILGAALLAMAAVSAGAQGIKKETLTEDPNVTRSLEPGSTPQGTRSPDPNQKQNENPAEIRGTVDRLRENPTDIQGNDVKRETRDSGQPQAEETAQDKENRAGVPDANEPEDQPK